MKWQVQVYDSSEYLSEFFEVSFNYFELQKVPVKAIVFLTRGHKEICDFEYFCSETKSPFF